MSPSRAAYLARRALDMVRIYGFRVTAQTVWQYLKRSRPQTPRLIAPPDVRTLVRNRFVPSRPISPLWISAGERRISIITTEKISEGTVFGGGGTSLILGALAARSAGAALRVVSRMEPANPDAFRKLLHTVGIPGDIPTEFLSLPADIDKDLEVTPQDRFITTSWWTTHSSLTLPPAHVTYLLQEDERLFYPSGDDTLLCSEIFNRKDIFAAVNTELLLRHLREERLPIASNAMAFEPAFPAGLFYRDSESSKRKERNILAFYARPNHPRNLFYLGLQAIDDCARRGIIDDSWEIVLLGTDIPRIAFAGGATVSYKPNLSWSAYADFARTIDVGVSLMASPHPSYPPLDLAASGAVVVTTRYGKKTDLTNYSGNIICSDPVPELLSRSIERAMALAIDEEARTKNYLSNNINRDWAEALGPVVQRIRESW